MTLTTPGVLRITTQLVETKHIGSGGRLAASSVAVSAGTGRCPPFSGSKQLTADDHRPKVLVVGEVDEEVDR